MNETIAVIFDFDDTLAPDSTSSFLASQGVDLNYFWREVECLIETGWDPVPAYLHHMITYAKQDTIEVSRGGLQYWGQGLLVHAGAGALFEQLRLDVQAISARVKLELYLISSGIRTLLAETSIAHHFTDIWASDFHYDDNGQAVCAKNVVSFTDKTRYIFHIQKGFIGPAYKNKPFCVNKKVASEHLRVPMQQMIVVGDGYTDIPMFSMVTRSGGMAIGVYDKSSANKKWQRAFEFMKDKRVTNLVSADYSPDSELSTILRTMVKGLCSYIVAGERAYQA